EWVDCTDATSSIISFLRRPASGEERVLVVCNFTPVLRTGYRVGVPGPGFWKELLNSDATDYGGSGQGNQGGLEAEGHPWHGHPWSLTLTIPPLAVVFFVGRKEAEPRMNTDAHR